MGECASLMSNAPIGGGIICKFAPLPALAAAFAAAAAAAEVTAGPAFPAKNSNSSPIVAEARPSKTLHRRRPSKAPESLGLLV